MMDKKIVNLYNEFYDFFNKIVFVDDNEIFNHNDKFSKFITYYYVQLENMIWAIEDIFIEEFSEIEKDIWNATFSSFHQLLFNLKEVYLTEDARYISEIYEIKIWIGYDFEDMYLLLNGVFCNMNKLEYNDYMFDLRKKRHLKKYNIVEKENFLI